jgi:glycine hydroxymethyltransferase
VDFDVLNKAKIQVRDLATSVGIDYEPAHHSYPHFYYMDDDLPDGAFLTIEIEGRESPDLLFWITTARPNELSPGDGVRSKLCMPGEDPLDIVLSRSKAGEVWNLVVERSKAARVLTWLRDLSDGYVHFDPADLHRKAPGPVIVRLGTALDGMPDAPQDDGGVSKPWFLSMPDGNGEPLSSFSWQDPEKDELKRTALFETHQALGAKLVPFAGWEMPVWYTSVLEEHQATRQSAGLFDVSHMGIYQVEGETAAAFLDCSVTNDVSRLKVGESHYTQFLNPDGHVIDDAMIYRRDVDRYLVVVNASNDDKNWAWLNAVRDGTVMIDTDRPWAKVYGQGCQICNLRSPEAGEEMRVDIALQGPKSRDILLKLGSDEATAKHLQSLPWAGVMEGVFGGIDLIVSRTGYTGERVAYELFVHPQKSVELWNALLKVGEGDGLKPVGLGARDSLRTEAGLPLYGQEMAGERDLGVGDAGFAGYVKTYKPWFIGRSAFLQLEAQREAEVTRFRFNDRGVRMAHYGDPVVDRRGRVIGAVTSCAVDGEGYLLGQAYLEKKYLEVATPIAIFQSAADKPGKAPSDLLVGDRVSIPTPATVLSRFPR